MSFHKRIITKTTLTRAFNNDGLLGVERLFRADALIISGTQEEQELISKINENIHLQDMDKTHILIKELISE